MPESISAATNQVLLTGRKGYVWDGTDWRPQASNTAGHIILGAGTAAAGTVAVSNVETIQTELYAAASVAASTNVASTVLSLVGVKRATFFIDHGRAGSAAFGTNGTEYRIEVSEQASNNDTWRSIASILASSAVAATLASSGSHAAAAGTITILSGTAAVRDTLYLFQTGTLEWMRSTTVSGTASFDILDGLTYAHAAGTISAGAEHFVLSLNVEAITRARVVINNNASGTTQAIAARIACITEK